MIRDFRKSVLIAPQDVTLMKRFESNVFNNSIIGQLRVKAEQQHDQLPSSTSEGNDYNESEDEDYDPNKADQDEAEPDKLNQNVNSKNIGDDKGGEKEDDEYNDDDFELGEEDKKEMRKYSAIESATGGLIKTRRQRQGEEEEAKLRKRQNLGSILKNNKTGSTDINNIWADMKGQSRKALSRSSTLGSSSEATTSRPMEEEVTECNSLPSNPDSQNPEKVKIKRTYEFAGKVVTEEKWVDRNSQEARAQVNSTKLRSEATQEDSKKGGEKRSFTQRNANLLYPLRRKRRRKTSLLEAVINNSSAAKISTLEKSRLDWATYVDQNKIHDELKYKNKAGYLANQDFLDRVNNRQASLFRDARSSSSKKKQ
ncbi:hypothetical protein FOA43_003635 [Brettanomyces nanus]|uniref:SWR1-complex protein 5 n=1 Tax=Eeniella nana TaxID=13502 RepID=A0A875S9C4_EENNA|nr:uncharacterized protein FOA43_003635 [Brettanomyces nanus]QPG76249.1 hypothetical protein FOA43_003635 [Brettanomyces nanus]